MKEVPITPEMIKIAEEKSEAMGVIKNSIEQGKGNIVGFLGELIAQKELGGEIKNTYEYDLILGDGTRVDVKSKKTSYKPRDYYECSIADYNTKQECDEYCFVRIKKDLSVGWFLGRLSKSLYFKKARFLKEGEVDGDNEFTVKSDCWNLAIEELFPA